MRGVADGFEIFLVNHVFFALYDLIFCVDKINRTQRMQGN